MKIKLTDEMLGGLVAADLYARLQSLQAENTKLRDENERLKACKAVLESAVKGFTVPATMNPNAGIVQPYPRGRWHP